MLPEAKLYHYKARAYDPTLGTFLQTDPIGTKGDLDLYAYTGDDPVNKADPSGLSQESGGKETDQCKIDPSSCVTVRATPPNKSGTTSSSGSNGDPPRPAPVGGPSKGPAPNGNSNGGGNNDVCATMSKEAMKTNKNLPKIYKNAPRFSSLTVTLPHL